MKQIVLVVGASGVGKDTLLKEAQNKMSFNFVKRYITREPDKNEQNYYVEENAFEVLKNSDFFIMLIFILLIAIQVGGVLIMSIVNVTDGTQQVHHVIVGGASDLVHRRQQQD